MEREDFGNLIIGVSGLGLAGIAIVTPAHRAFIAFAAVALLLGIVVLRNHTEIDSLIGRQDRAGHNSCRATAFPH